MKFKGFEKTSLIEWPGKMAAVAYTGGCNFRCPYCQNKALVLGPENVPDIDGEEILEFLVSRKRWIDGLMITGGEPTVHPSLSIFSKKVKEAEIGLGIETNGSNPEKLKELIDNNLADRISLDIKAPLKLEKYQKIIGVKEEKVLENLKKSMEILRNSDIGYEIRTTVVPELLSKKDILEIGSKINESEEFYLQQFVPQNTLDKKYESIEPYSVESLKKMKKDLKKRFGLEKVGIRNI